LHWKQSGAQWHGDHGTVNLASGVNTGARESYCGARPMPQRCLELEKVLSLPRQKFPYIVLASDESPTVKHG
jgi:hypothetical protein